MTKRDSKRFEELCDLIVIEHDAETFSALVTELNQLDPTRRLPVVSKPHTSGDGQQQWTVH